MSMDNEIVAKRYALALFELMKESGSIAQAEKEVELVYELFSDEKLRKFLAYPTITVEQKKTLISEHLKDKVSKHVLNTVLFMLDRKRGDCIADMAKQFIKLAMEEQQEAEAVVYSVTPLSEEHKQTVSTLIAQKVGKRNLRMKNEIQPDLIGGLKIRVGNQIFDGSIKGRLEKLKRKLTEVEA